MSSLIIKTSGSYLSERSYIIDLVIKQWLGLKFEHQIWEETYSQIMVTEDNGFSLSISDTFFQTPKEVWLTAHSLPKTPLSLMKIVDYLEEIPLTSGQVPIIFGSVNPAENIMDGKWQQIEPYLWTYENNSYLSIDIFGSAFFMLTRYEEYVKPDRDQHDRFPATASLAYQEGFLDRPIINEYLEILWYCMKRLWPGLERKQRNFRTIVSHDIDVPFTHALVSIKQLIISCGGDVLNRKTPSLALKRANSWYTVKRRGYRMDNNYTFDRIMDISEQNGLQSAFYFQTDCTDAAYDHSYSIGHPYIRQLMRDMYQRGHEIGIHPSYNTYQDPNRTKLEFEKLLKACEEERIEQDKWGGRQHYLRWNVPITWRNWNEAGINYDSTLGYADHAGFRCGVCYEFPVYDVKQRKHLPLIERPLIVMEGSIFDVQYMGFSGQEAIDYMVTLKQRCQRHRGDFTLLWHNSSFNTPQMWAMYTEILMC